MFDYVNSPEAFMEILSLYSHNSEVFARKGRMLEDIQDLLARFGKSRVVDITDQSGNTMLHLIEDPKIVELLIRNGTNIIGQNFLGNTPLHMSCSKEKTEILLKAGAGPNIRNERGATPLHAMAAQGKDIEILRLLVRFGADIEARDGQKFTPLLEAVNTKHIEFLLNEGADPNVVNCWGNGLLHYVKEPKQIRLLIEWKADIELRDSFGNTPLFTAYNLACAKVLIDSGANMRGKNSTGVTPAEYHRQNDKPDIAEYIENRIRERERMEIERDMSVRISEDNMFERL